MEYQPDKTRKGLTVPALLRDGEREWAVCSRFARCCVHKGDKAPELQKTIY
ncbi:hypothetical protein [Cohnella kolymensis]|uniref:hypothetical protein n=1 Tax=Cohnella kolymensis TaxID=1590652 RepID=UPI00137929E1|nr:hypothetical protein [Cohnella kolymensis]